MPLTDVNQSGYDWHKHPHTKILLNARIRTLKPAHKGMLWMLMEYSALEVPFGSLENDAERLAEMAGVSLSVWSKSSDVVMGAAFVRCNDDRWYCPLMIDELSPAQQDTDAKPAKAKKPVSAALSAKRAEAAAASHAKRKAKLQADNANLQSDHANFANDELQNCKPVANALQNGGIKGGDLDPDLELDSDLNQNLKNIRATESSAGRVSAFKTELSEVFEHWKTVFKKNSATKLDDKRKSKIVARLKDGYTVDQIKQAINGCAASEYHVENHHTDIELICRDVVKIDKFIELSSVAKKPSPSKPVHGNVNAAWGNPPAQNLDSGYVMDPELAKRIAELPV